MSSSFPVARFPALPLGKDGKVSTDEILYKDKVVSGDGPSDELLIDRIRSRDNEALTLLFRRYSRLVWFIAQRVLRDSAEAEDVMQDVFLTVYQKTGMFDASKGPARTLIVYITYRLAYKRRRYLTGRHAHYSWRSNDCAAVSTAVTMPSFDDSVEAHFGSERLRDAIAGLSDAQRETLRLYFVEGYELDEISAKLGQSLGNVRHHYFRGLDRLRKHMPRSGQ